MQTNAGAKRVQLFDWHFNEACQLEINKNELELHGSVMLCKAVRIRSKNHQPSRLSLHVTGVCPEEHGNPFLRVLER